MDLVAIIREADVLKRQAAALKERIGQEHDGAAKKSALRNALSVAHGSTDALAKAAGGVGDAVRGALGEALIAEAEASLGGGNLEVVQAALEPSRLKLLAKELAAKSGEEEAGADAPDAG